MTTRTPRPIMPMHNAPPETPAPTAVPTLVEKRIKAAVALALVRAARASWMLALRAVSELDEWVPDSTVQDARSIEPTLDRIERVIVRLT